MTERIDPIPLLYLFTFIDNQIAAPLAENQTLDELGHIQRLVLPGKTITGEFIPTSAGETKEDPRELVEHLSIVGLTHRLRARSQGRNRA